MAQDVINLPPPQMQGGLPLMEALAARHSDRDYTTDKLDDQQLSDLLWAACGINRPADGKRTVPSSHNKQEIDVYVALADGLFRYDHKAHTLIRILGEDIRMQTGKQDFVGVAAVSLIYVADYSRIEDKPETRQMTTGIDAGVMVQNVYLYCASAGLGSVVRAWFDREVLTKAMQLKDNQEVVVCQTVGVVKQAKP